MFKIINPATEESIQEVFQDTADTIKEKFKSARAAQQDWAALPLDERRKIIQRFSSSLSAGVNGLAPILTAETGKPITQARAEIESTPKRIQFFLDNVKQALTDRNYPEGWVSYAPLGVIANISAWNYPYFVGSNVFIPALLTGNAVLYKPSEFATMTGLAIADLLHAAGVPKEIFAVVQGGAEAGDALLDLPLNGVFFTGSADTGRHIDQRLGGRLIPRQLELGGKDPAYVAEDVDLGAAISSLADGAFYNGGQSCCSVERIYVHHQHYEPFLEGFVEAVESFVVGDPMDDATYLGPLCRKAQIPFLSELVRDAQSKGAHCLTGGNPLHRKSGFFFEPTVLADTKHSMRVMREEAFGPIVGIQKVKSDEEAIRLMNDTNYGLTASVYCRSRKKAQELLGNIHSGTAYWNACDKVEPCLPWAARKGSGIGCTLGLEGIRCFTQPRSWHIPTPQIP